MKSVDWTTENKPKQLETNIVKNTFPGTDNHDTTYAADFLIQFDYKTWKSSRRLNPLLWRGPKVADKIARVNAAEFLSTQEGSRRVFQSLLDYGVSLIDGVIYCLHSIECHCFS